MIESKSKFVTIMGYLIIGFFVLIIGFMFGVPNMMPKSPSLENAFTVNGKGVTIQQFYRHIPLIGERDMPDEKQRKEFALQKYSRMIQMNQLAAKEGVDLSDSAIEDFFVNYPALQNPDGSFNREKFKANYMSMGLSEADFVKVIKEMEIARKMEGFLYGGSTISKDEILFAHYIDQLEFQLKYAFLSNDDIKKKYADRLVVTQEEITAAVNKQKEKKKDKETKISDTQIKMMLEQEKLQVVKNEIIQSASNPANVSKGFEGFLAENGIKGDLSKPFKLGETIQSSDGKPLSGLTNLDLLSVDAGKNLKGVNSFTGVYFYLPANMKNAAKPFAKEDEEKLKMDIGRKSQYSAYIAIEKYMDEHYKVMRNNKFLVE